MNSKTYRVVLIEPSPIVQEGLKAVISHCRGFEVVGSVYDMHHQEEYLAMMRADIVVLNPALIEFHRRNTVKNLFEGVVLVALVYSYTDHEMLKQFASVIDIYDDQSKIDAKLREAVTVESQQDEFASEGNELSEREKEILIAVAKGMINKEIAALHNISIHTVISHRKNISRKTGIKSISGLAVYALLNKMIEQNEIQ